MRSSRGARTRGTVSRPRSSPCLFLAGRSRERESVKKTMVIASQKGGKKTKEERDLRYVALLRITGSRTSIRSNVVTRCVKHANTRLTHCGNDLQGNIHWCWRVIRREGRGGTFSLSSLFSNVEKGREREIIRERKTPPPAGPRREPP